VRDRAAGGRIDRCSKGPDITGRYFSLIDWTAYVIFIVVVGVIGTIERPIVGVIAFLWLRSLLYRLWFLVCTRDRFDRRRGRVVRSRGLRACLLDIPAFAFFLCAPAKTASRRRLRLTPPCRIVKRTFPISAASWRQRNHKLILPGIFWRSWSK
jgi:hypothetical protein